MAYLISHEAANYCKSGRQAVTASIPLFHGCSSKDPSADYAPLQQEKYIDPIKAFPIVPLSQISQTRFASPLPKPEIAPLLPGMQTYSGSLDQQQQSLRKSIYI